MVIAGLQVLKNNEFSFSSWSMLKITRELVGLVVCLYILLTLVLTSLLYFKCVLPRTLFDVTCSWLTPHLVPQLPKPRGVFLPYPVHHQICQEVSIRKNWNLSSYFHPYCPFMNFSKYSDYLFSHYLSP